VNLLVKRRWLTELSTSGELWLDGQFFCFTLEPPTHSDDVKPRAIPPGSYDLAISFSPRFRRLMPHVLNVPDFEGILIHFGNYPHDTEGCLLVGSTRSADFVGHSDATFAELFNKLDEAAGPHHITYLDPDVD
jgi:hypothetical protein